MHYININRFKMHLFYEIMKETTLNYYQNNATLYLSVECRAKVIPTKSVEFKNIPLLTRKQRSRNNKDNCYIKQ